MQASAMARILRRFALFLSIFAFALGGPSVLANPVGDFFKRIGHSISSLGKSPTPTPTPRKKQRGYPKRQNGHRQKGGAESTFGDALRSRLRRLRWKSDRPRLLRPTAADRRDLPYGVAVPDRPGLVTSPYAPNQGLVDVRAFPKSTEVMDPFTGKVFLTP